MRKLLLLVLALTLGPELSQSSSREILYIWMPESPLTENDVNYWKFVRAVGFRESLNNFLEDSNPDYKGCYQIGEEVLKTLKIKVSLQQFLLDSALQEYTMFKLLERNHNLTEDLVAKYEGKIINGITVTKSGILAAAHLGGHGSIRLFLTRRIDKKDNLGTHCSEYLRLFSGCQFDLTKINTKYFTNKTTNN